MRRIGPTSLVTIRAPAGNRIGMWHTSRDRVYTQLIDITQLQFTINKTVYKIFRAMSKDLYSDEICVHFGIDSVENIKIK